MRTSPKCIALSTTAFFTLLIINPALSRADLLNYDNDPDLHLALHYDAEMNGGDMKVSSQSLAEKSYVAYLQHATDPDQIAEVYVQLGVLYSTNWYKSKGESPDFQKAQRYFASAIAAAGDHLGLPIVRAHAGAITPLQTSDQRLDARIHAYSWLKTINAKTLRDHWLKARPDEQPTDDTINSTLAIIANIMDAERTNMIADAKDCADPVARSKDVQAAIAPPPPTGTPTKGPTNPPELK